MTPNSFQLSLQNSGSLALLLKDIQRAVQRELLLHFPDISVLPLTGESSTTHLEPEGDKLRLVLQFQVTPYHRKENVPPSGE